MKRIRIGVSGAGTIAQVEHIPNLLRLSEKFELVGICDPSPSTRQFIELNYGIKCHAALSDLLDQRLDALVVASPDALHKEQVLAALSKGLHVFCEKPLCYGTEDIAELISSRDRAQRVLQVGYMKRFDPAYEAAFRFLPSDASRLRHISVEVVDADAWPFILHHRTHRATDVPSELIPEARAKQREQVGRAVGADLTGMAYQGFCSAYCSSLVHDVNSVHGLLDRLGISKGKVAGASFFAGGAGGQGSVELLDGQALWTMTHLSIPNLPYYSERISLHFDDLDIELQFPSPYLNNQPTRLLVRSGDGANLHTAEVHAGYKEAFVEELLGFWSAINEGAPVRNSAEQAQRDMALLADMARWQVKQKAGQQL